MDQTLPTKPKYVNNQHFSSEQFPEIIGFCDRDNTTHITANDEESYQYKFHDQIIYTVKKKENRWEILEFSDTRIVRVSTGNKLGPVLFHALTFHETERLGQEKRTNILFPVSKTDTQKALAIMYYLGGYPEGLLEMSPEFLLIKEQFIDPENHIDFLTYSYVPVEYIPWLREQLKQSGLIGQDKNRALWIYKK